MKFSPVATIAVAVVAGVSAVPVDSGPMADLQARASDAIGGIVHYIRRDQAGTPVVPEVKRSPIRFHSSLDHENALKRRKSGGGKNDDPPPPLVPFVTESGQKKRAADLTRRDAATETTVPPLAPFSTGGKRTLRV